ncbi:MAG: hypothetical protein R3F20_05250 [Planctomycetota bacterium]
MKPRLALALAALIVLVGVGLVAGPGLLRRWKAARADVDAVAELPLDPEITVREVGGGEVDGVRISWVEQVATMRAYSSHGCGVLDIGDLRLVVPGGRECPSTTWSGVRLSTTIPVEADVEGRTEGSAQGCRITIRSGRGRTLVTWGEVDFEIVEAELRFDGRSFPFGLGPRMLVVEPGNLLVEARPISPRGR